LKHVKAVEKMASNVAKHTVSRTMNALKKLKDAKQKQEKPEKPEKPKRPKPVRAPRKSLKHVKAVQKLAASIANNATSKALNRWKTIRNVSQYRIQGPNPEPNYPYGLLGRQDSPTVETPVLENIGMVPPKKKRPPSKKSRKSKASLSANQVSADQVVNITPEVRAPSRSVTLNQVDTFNTKKTFAEANQDVQFFKTALSARKKQSQSKAKERKTYSKFASLLKEKGLGPKEGMNVNSYTEYLREKLKGMGETI
jgi:hypothetical protein